MGVRAAQVDPRKIETYIYVYGGKLAGPMQALDKLFCPFEFYSALANCGAEEHDRTADSCLKLNGASRSIKVNIFTPTNNSEI